MILSHEVSCDLLGRCMVGLLVSEEHCLHQHALLLFASDRGVRGMLFDRLIPVHGPPISSTPGFSETDDMFSKIDQISIGGVENRCQSPIRSR